MQVLRTTNFVAAPDSGKINLRLFTLIEDAAAEVLIKYEGDLELDGLTSLSDAAAKSLSKHEGNLSLDGLTSLSDMTAGILSKHKGDLSLVGLTSLSDVAAKSLCKHEGDLWLNGLTLPHSHRFTYLANYQAIQVSLSTILRIQLFSTRSTWMVFQRAASGPPKTCPHCGK